MNGIKGLRSSLQPVRMKDSAPSLHPAYEAAIPVPRSHSQVNSDQESDELWATLIKKEGRDNNNVGGRSC